jgi:hypothetical protein
MTMALTLPLTTVHEVDESINLVLMSALINVY